MKWICNAAFTHWKLSYNSPDHVKKLFLIFKLIFQDHSFNSLTYINLSPLKNKILFLIIVERSLIYQNMRNFKQNKNAIYAFLCEFNSFWVIYKKLLKIEGIFHGGLKNSCFFICQDWSWETASWILRNIYKKYIESYLD